ncbi:hypothetical protein [Pseudomonas sp. BN515]|uniref:hypothetical protein n=1 Tax=Pseudomonas sp. BN515 TaxID=2567892 RepID=UPI0024574107|nr:hypothetical protein [Pseudomonas sp. BN515]MDH4869833.1 hypothetical protein [Pseudomonas sp. BN515]
MALPNDPLDLAVLLHQQMLESQFIEGGFIEGVLPETWDFQQVVDQLDALGLRSSEVAAERRLEFSAPHNFFWSLDALLVSAERRIQPPARFYLADLRYSHPAVDADIPVAIARYQQAAQLFRALRGIADHETKVGNSSSLIFLQQQKLEITAGYQATDLAELSQLDEFESDFIESTTHKQQKATILRSVLFELFGGQTKTSFASVLANFKQLVDQVVSSYQLYVSEFSFQKVKAEVEKEKLEFTTKLNKVFADIQNQLLAVPAALILIGGQMENGRAWSIKNLLIWSGAIVFALLMNLLINNQRHTLRAIKLEIDQQWELIQGKHKTVADQFKSNYRQLDDRYQHQHRLLGTVSTLVAAALAFATGMLLWYSVPELHFFQSIIWGVTLGVPTYGLYQLALYWRERAR